MHIIKAVYFKYKLDLGRIIDLVYISLGLFAVHNTLCKFSFIVFK